MEVGVGVIMLDWRLQTTNICKIALSQSHGMHFSFEKSQRIVGRA